MRVLIYALILSMLPFAPLHRLDVAQLEPVQTLAVRIINGSISMETDTGQKGQGDTVQRAIADLEVNTPGVIYLDTVQYLLVTNEAVENVDALRKYLRPQVYVCIWDGTGSVSSAAEYLKKRTDLPRIGDWKLPDKKS